MFWSKWVIIFESPDHNDVAFKHSKLRSNGIRCKIKSITQGYPSGKPISSRLLVHKDDEFKSLKILSEG